VDKPLVSAVIPVYNGERYLPEALRSVFEQTYENIEVVCVDDGSTDRSAEILASYGDRLIAVRQENAGVGAARNTGMKTARGDFVALMDQDDWWRPEKTEKQVAGFLADESLGLVHTASDHYDESSGAFVGPLDPEAEPHLLVGDCYRRLLLDNQIYNSSVMARKSVLDRVGYCDARIGGNTVVDYDLWLRIAKVSRLGFIDEPLVVFRLHSAQGTWDRRKMLGAEAMLLERVLDEGETEIFPELRARMARLYDALAVAHLDQGEPREARRNFARSWRWKANRRAALGWAACLLPGGMIRRLKARRNRRETS
jgi:glycosyltransferase involved in cell wall biosynthesis